MEGTRAHFCNKRNTIKKFINNLNWYLGNLRLPQMNNLLLCLTSVCYHICSYSTHYFMIVNLRPSSLRVNTLMCIFNVYLLPKPIMKLYQVIAPFLRRISVLMSFFKIHLDFPLCGSKKHSKAMSSDQQGSSTNISRSRGGRLY